MMAGLIPWRKKKRELADRRGQMTPFEDFTFSLSRMRDEFDRFFEQMTREFGDMNDGGWRWGIDVEDKDDTIIVRAEAPGFDTDDLDVRVEDHHLVLKASKKNETRNEQGKLQEYREQECYEMVALPAGIDKDRVDAQYRNGVLTVTLAKTDDGKAKRINVKAT
jgi:HSP20 family protein